MSLSEKISTSENLVPTNLLYFVYICAFIFCSFLIFAFEGEPFITMSCILFFLTLSAKINVYYIKKYHHESEVLDHLNQVYEEFINNNILFSLLLNDQNKIIFNKNNKIPGFEFENIATIDDALKIFQKMNNSQEKLEEISDFIFSDFENSSQKIIGPILYHEKYICISLNCIIKPEKYKLIKIFEQNYLTTSIEVSNQLSIGYYELNKDAKILGANEYFCKLLGVDNGNFNGANFYLKDLINYESSTNSLTQDSNNLDVLKGNWQGFLIFNSKFKEKLNMFVVHKAIHNEYNVLSKIQGFVIKLQDQSLILKSKGLENGWIDYSWRCFFEYSPDPVTVLNEYGKITHINQAFTKLLPQDYYNKFLADVFEPDDQLLIKETINSLINSKNQIVTLNNLQVFGNKNILNLHFCKILDLTGNTLGFMARAEDVTGQKELEVNLSHAQRMQTIGHLVGSVAHDFNNLLTAIGGFSDLLLLRHHSGDPSFVNIIQIKQSSDRASSLVKRLLAFSRKQTLKPTVVDLNEAFSDFYGIIKRLIGNDITFTQQVSPIIWKVKIDPVQMEQVILNLAVNAHQAMLSGGKLDINVENCYLNEQDLIFKDFIAPSGEKLPPAGEYVKITVQDTGSGIPADIMQKIFEPFFTTKNDKSGTGLGLATVYGIIRQSEGYIYVKSDVGLGTNFIIFLKHHEATEEEIIELQKKLIADETAFRIPNQDLSGQETIVLVEDEESVRLFTKSALINKGYNVIEYSSAKQALESADEFLNIVDLIITDVIMPDMTGPTMVTEIKKLKPKIKVIFISGFGEEAFTEEYGSDRNFHFIAKPFSLKQLVIKVKEVIH